MKAYLDILDNVLSKGKPSSDRTGTGTIMINGEQFKHDMADGFPLLTTKDIRPEKCWGELEFFIKGYSDKEWLRERDIHIWDDWCNPYALSRYSFSNLNDQEFTDETAQSDYNALDNALSDIRPSVRMLKRHKALEEEIKNYFEAVEGTGELALVKPADDNLKELLRKFGQYVMSDLGPVYGWQWRHSGAEYQMDGLKPAHMIDYSGQGVDQLEKIVNGLKRSPESRRLVVSAWNPKDLAYMALEPCHDSFQVSVRDGKLDLTWRQRSVDCALGLPFNIASYATLLHLLAMETGYEEGDLTGHLGNTHIYNNHIDGVKEQLTRKPGKLPTIHTENFDTIYDWHYTDSRIEGYDPQPKIQFPLAV